MISRRQLLYHATLNAALVALVGFELVVLVHLLIGGAW
jgi:hypothetical protein